MKNKEGLLLRTLLWFDGDKQTFTPMTMTSAREIEGRQETCRAECSQ